MGTRLALLLLIACRGAHRLALGVCGRSDPERPLHPLRRIEPGEYGPGLHFKSPLLQVHRFDRRVITRAYAGENLPDLRQQAAERGFLSQVAADGCRATTTGDRRR